MKTVKEWFELIKDEKIRQEALENMNPEWSDNELENINKAILDGFTWRDTPKGQGFYYWDMIHDGNIELLEENSLLEHIKAYFKEAKEQPSPSPIIENAFNNIKTLKQMNAEELINIVSGHKDLINHVLKRLEDIEKRIDEAPNKTAVEPQERKLIMSLNDIDKFEFNKWLGIKNKKLMFNLFSELKFIEQQWNEGKEFDWENEDDKYCLFLHENKWRYLCFGISHQIFNFHTKEHAELFLKTFAKELEIIKPLFS